MSLRFWIRTMRKVIENVLGKCLVSVSLILNLQKFKFKNYSTCIKICFDNAICIVDDAISSWPRILLQAPTRWVTPQTLYRSWSGTSVGGSSCSPSSSHSSTSPAPSTSSRPPSRRNPANSGVPVLTTSATSWTWTNGRASAASSNSIR